LDAFHGGRLNWNSDARVLPQEIFFIHRTTNVLPPDYFNVHEQESYSSQLAVTPPATVYSASWYRFASRLA
jgi:hypothetical protein